MLHWSLSSKGMTWDRRGRAEESGAPWLAGEMVHVNCRLNEVADKNVDNTPEWLSDAKIAAFMAKIPAAEAQLVG